MNDEIDGPSPEERGLTSAGEAPANSEELGNLFESQVNHDIEGQSQDIVELDKTRLYVNLHRKWSQTGAETTHRMYSGLNPSSGTDNQVFHNLSTAKIYSVEGDDLAHGQFVKFGREAPSTMSPAKFNLGGEKESEELSLGISLDDDEKSGINYKYRHIKGSELGFSVSYDKHGELTNLSRFWGEDHFLESFGRFDNSPKSNTDLEFSVSEKIVTLPIKEYNRDSTQYEIKIPQFIDIKRVFDETGVEQVLRRPNSPPEADDQWRYANFPQLIGIEIEPVHDIEAA